MAGECSGDAMMGAIMVNGSISGEEITKRSIRVQVWKKLLEQKAATHTNYVYNRITNFVGAEKAAALLADTQEFKNARKYSSQISLGFQGVVKSVPLLIHNPLSLPCIFFFHFPPNSAERIKINTDKPQEPIKLLALGAGKPLFVSPARDSTALLAKIEAPADADLTVQKQLIRPQALRENGQEISEYSPNYFFFVLTLGALGKGRG